MEQWRHLWKIDLWFLRFPRFHACSLIHQFVTLSGHQIKSIQNRTRMSIVFNPIKHHFNLDSLNHETYGSRKNSTELTTLDQIHIYIRITSNIIPKVPNQPPKYALLQLSIINTVFFRNAFWHRSMTVTSSLGGEEPLSDEWRLCRIEIARSRQQKSNSKWRNIGDWSNYHHKSCYTPLWWNARYTCFILSYLIIANKIHDVVIFDVVLLVKAHFPYHFYIDSIIGDLSA